MKQLKILATLLAILALASPVLAQDDNDVGIFADLGAVSGAITADPFVTFEYYALMYNPGDVFGYELTVIQNPLVTVLSRNTTPLGALDVGVGDDNYIVGTGFCLQTNESDGLNGWFSLVCMQGLLFNPDIDILACIGPSFPSTDGAGVPQLLRCDLALEPMAPAQNGDPNYPNGCGVINATFPPPIPNAAKSFGSLKAGFGK